MFDMETALAAWRREITASIKVPQRREELESHLREEIERQLRSGANAAGAFAAAVAQIGPAQPIKAEFAKVDAESWSLPLAWAAWVMFAASFFLPAFFVPDINDSSAGWLWWVFETWEIPLSALFAGAWRYMGAGYILLGVHLGLLTLANLLMVASVFWLRKFSHHSRAMNLFRRLSFVALLLVWAFFWQLLAHGFASRLEIGYFLWTASFLPLWLCTLPRWGEIKAKGRMKSVK